MTFCIASERPSALSSRKTVKSVRSPGFGWISSYSSLRQVATWTVSSLHSSELPTLISTVSPPATGSGTSSTHVPVAVSLPFSSSVSPGPLLPVGGVRLLFLSPNFALRNTSSPALGW